MCILGGMSVCGCQVTSKGPRKGVNRGFKGGGGHGNRTHGCGIEFWRWKALDRVADRAIGEMKGWEHG